MIRHTFCASISDDLTPRLSVAERCGGSKQVHVRLASNDAHDERYPVTSLPSRWDFCLCNDEAARLYRLLACEERHKSRLFRLLRMQVYLKICKLGIDKLLDSDYQTQSIGRDLRPSQFCDANSPI
jgi:hypothetical protein